MRRRPAVVVLGVVVLAVAIGGIVLAAVTGGGSDKLALNAQEQHGREVFIHNCQQCHTLQATNAVGMIGPNLDTWTPLGVPVGVVESAVRQGRTTPGGGIMPSDLVVGSDVTAVATFVHRVTEDSARARGGPPPLDWGGN
jgi:mono/diheme cytochrome c family protein